MFGVLRGAGCGLGPEGRSEWMGQICGVCLALGRGHGQAARLATIVAGYDAALLSALVEAQQADAPARSTHLCPLRPGLRGQVAEPGGLGPRYGAAAALMIAAARIGDDVADGETYTRIPGAASLGRLASRAAAKGLAALGIDPAPLAGAAAAQPALEEQAPDPVAGAEPTARACAAAFAQTAALAGIPDNAEPLSRAGRAYGRIIYLIDAVRDQRADAARGRFNPLLAGAAPIPLFRSWHAELLAAIDAADLVRPGLVRDLLDGGLARAWRAAMHSQEGQPRKAGRRVPDNRPGWCESDGSDGCSGCGDACECCCDCTRCGGKGGSHCCGKGGGGCNCCDCDCNCCDCNCCDCNCCDCDCNCCDCGS